ncbi:MAG: hypothetical protein PVH68_17720 [Armatimonadota bacterium]|jgi:hypothetical protein
MRRTAAFIILVVGLLHVHCACGAFEAPLALLQVALPEAPDHHSHSDTEEACAADDGVVPPRATLFAPDTALPVDAPPDIECPSPARFTAVPEPCIALVVVRLISSQPLRAPPAS